MAVIQVVKQKEDAATLANHNNNNNNPYNCWVRPRILYASIFVWISLTGGRFLAPLLQDAGLSESHIGLCLALQTVISSVCSSASGAYADAYERRNPGRGGRARLLMGGILAGSLAFLIQGLLHRDHDDDDGLVVVVGDADDIMEDNNNSSIDGVVIGHVVLRCIYAASTSMVFPILDGLTLDFLTNDCTTSMDDGGVGGSSSSKADFGQERLWGAVSWAIANLIMGPSLDRWGFSILYLYAILSTFGVVVTVIIFTTSQQQLQKGYSSIMAIDATNAVIASEAFEDEGGSNNIAAPPLSHELKRQKSHYVVQDPERIDDESIPFRKLLQIIFATSFGAAFILAIFCLSIGTAVVESLVFLYFELLGSSFTLCAFTVLLTVVFEIPIFHVAPKLLKTYGSTKMLLMACFCYVTRVVGYSMVPEGQPWWVLIFEPLHGITYACASLSSVDFVAQLVPKGYEATGQGMLSSLRGCGSVLGLLLSGYGEELFGARIMYRVLAAIVTIGFSILLLALSREFTPTNSTGAAGILHTTGNQEGDLAVEGNVDRGASNVELVGTKLENGLQYD